MKKPVKLKKLIIDRNTWARGGQNGSAALLNKEGNMCCLGFACERQGIPKAELKEYGEPGDLLSTTPATPLHQLKQSWLNVSEGWSYSRRTTTPTTMKMRVTKRLSPSTTVTGPIKLLRSTTTWISVTRCANTACAQSCARWDLM